MKTIGRRRFFRNLLTGSVIAGAGAAQAVKYISPTERLQEK
jgi:hypothetical protein